MSKEDISALLDVCSLCFGFEDRLRLVNFPPLMKSSSVSPTQDECSYGPTRLQVSQRKSNRAYAYSSHPSSSKTDPENTTRSGLHVRL